MNTYKADLHIHTVLSPCGDLEMSPANIVRIAKQQGLGIIGITDHNSTKQCRVVQEIGKKQGIEVLAGAEVTSREEVHCLAFFENDKTRETFQQFLDANLPAIENKPEKFGYQVVVDADDMIQEEEHKLLISAINAGMNEIATKVHALGGIFIPAHVDKLQNSIYSQLGFIPPDLEADGMEISRHITREQALKQHQELSGFAVIQSSDAHYPQEIGAVYTEFHLDTPAFSSIKQALYNKQAYPVK